MKEPTKPADATKRLFADSPVRVRELAVKAHKERRQAARERYARANGLSTVKTPLK